VNSSTISTHSLVLDRLKFLVQDMVSREAINDFANRPEVQFFELAHSMSNIVLRARYDILGKEETRKFKYPATAWDHVKRDLIPTFTEWFGLRVNYTHVTVDAKMLFPKIKIRGSEYKVVYWTDERSYTDGQMDE
jgi:hypothetical protein